MFKGLFKLAILVGIVVVAVNYSHEFKHYAVDSAHSVRDWAKQLPIDSRIHDDRDQLARIDPEIQATVRSIAQHETAISDLKKEIEQDEQQLAGKTAQLVSVRDAITTNQDSVTIDTTTYSHDQLKDELTRRFEGVKQSRLAVADKRKVLEARQEEMTDGIHALDKARARRAYLETEIAALEGTQTLVQSSESNSTEPAIKPTTQPVVVAKESDAHELVQQVNEYLAAQH
jgi:chromosome segregation ATPase